MKDITNQIETVDCLTALRILPHKCVDFVFTDPPYNVGKKYDGYDDDRAEHEYWQWMSKIVYECRRVARRGVAFYVSGSMLNDFLAYMPTADVIVVSKRAAGIAKDNVAMQYHVVLATAKPLRRMRNLWDDIRLPGEGYYFREERFDNPGLTSKELTKRAIQYYTEEGELVLDPFMGVGTTAVACIETGRNYAGFEQSAKYVEIARQRIAAASYIPDPQAVQQNLFVQKGEENGSN